MKKEYSGEGELSVSARNETALFRGHKYSRCARDGMREESRNAARGRVIENHAISVNFERKSHGFPFTVSEGRAHYRIGEWLFFSLGVR